MYTEIRHDGRATIPRQDTKPGDRLTRDSTYVAEFVNTPIRLDDVAIELSSGTDLALPLAIDFLFVMAGPGVGGGEVDEIDVRVTLQNCHQDTLESRGFSRNSFKAGEAVLAEKRVPEAEVRMRVRIVGNVRKRDLSLRSRARYFSGRPAWPDRRLRLRRLTDRCRNILRAIWPG
jgi:hypothetical protein